MQIEEAVAQVVQDVIQLHQRIADADVDEGDVWFKNLFCRILTAALQDFEHVRITQPVNFIAMSRRNLLELEMITRYVLASERGAVKVKHDLLIDAKEFWEACSKHMKASHKQLLAGYEESANAAEGSMKQIWDEAFRIESERGPQTAECDAEADACRAVLSEEGVGEKEKPITPTSMAGELKRSEDFNPMFKLCSKLMHRTSLSVASTQGTGNLDAIIPTLKNSAVGDLLSVFSQIKQYVELNGVSVPGKR
jgi:hypothetical protein